MFFKRHIRAVVTATTVVLLNAGWVGAGMAASYPDKALRIVVPYPAGGTTDIIGRLVAQELHASLGQPVIVENKPGAGGNIGADLVAKAAPDGYTLLLVASGILAINPALYKNMPFDAEVDLAPVASVASLPNVMLVSPKNKYGIASFADFLETGKREQPGALNLGSTGNGSAIHLLGTLMSKETGVEMMHVPYRGSSPMLQAVYSGDVDVAFDNIPAALPHVQGGKIQAVMITCSQRSPLLPEVPTVHEMGFPALDLSAWFGVMAPAGTPPDVIELLNRKLNESLASEAFRTKIANLGMQGLPGSAADFKTLIHDQSARWRTLVIESGAVID